MLIIIVLLSKTSSESGQWAWSGARAARERAIQEKLQHRRRQAHARKTALQLERITPTILVRNVLVELKQFLFAHFF